MKDEKRISDAEFRVSDLGIAACLLANGAHLLCLEPETDRRVAFVFAFDSDLDQQEREYLLGDLTVNARRYFQAIKDLKFQLHAFLGRRN